VASNEVDTNVSSTPLVSIVTPVYNGADFLAECIESVLNQTYEHFEYLIVNNRSTDRTLEIALSYAEKDRRITVHDNDSFLGVIPNHNRAFGLISPASKYCKVVSADDFIFPECLALMVALAEANPSVGMVGSYMLAGKRVMNAGLEYERKVVSGYDICRATLLGGPYVFGSPTSLLYRADLIRKSDAFYPTDNPHADTTACYRWLEDCEFGFVHQVLSYARIHPDSQTSLSIKLGRINRALMADQARFGPKYLSPDELKERLARSMDEYYGWLVRAGIEHLRDNEFWRLQDAELAEIGFKLSIAKLCRAAFLKAVGSARRPGVALRKLFGASKNAGKIEARYYE
jgi:glycosyltransferase involved in cell wall biosynthesis